MRTKDKKSIDRDRVRILTVKSIFRRTKAKINNLENSTSKNSNLEELQSKAVVVTN